MSGIFDKKRDRGTGVLIDLFDSFKSQEDKMFESVHFGNKPKPKAKVKEGKVPKDADKKNPDKLIKTLKEEYESYKDESGDMVYVLPYDFTKIEQIPELAKEDKKLYDFLTSKLGSNEGVSNKDKSVVFWGSDIQDYMRGIASEKVDEQEEVKMKVLARGVSDEDIAKDIAAKTEGASAIPDKDDENKWMVVVKESVNEYAYDVFLDGKEIDTVFYQNKEDPEDVKKSLVDHDGYDPNIVVKLVEKSVNEAKKKDPVDAALKSMAKDAGTNYTKAKNIFKEEEKKRMKKEKKKKDELTNRDYKYIMGVTKKRLGLKTKKVKESKYALTEEQYKSDADIAKEFEGMKITNIEVKPSGQSGWIEVEFPEGGEHVGGGADSVVDSWIKYDSGKIAFDNWYPEDIYNKLVDAIEAKLAEANESTNECFNVGDSVSYDGKEGTVMDVKEAEGKIRIAAAIKDFKESWDFDELNRLASDVGGTKSMGNNFDTGSDSDVMILSSVELTPEQQQALFNAADMYIADDVWKGDSVEDIISQLEDHMKERMGESKKKNEQMDDVNDSDLDYSKTTYGKKVQVTHPKVADGNPLEIEVEIKDEKGEPDAKAGNLEQNFWYRTEKGVKKEKYKTPAELEKDIGDLLKSKGFDVKGWVSSTSEKPEKKDKKKKTKESNEAKGKKKFTMEIDKDGEVVLKIDGKKEGAFTSVEGATKHMESILKKDGWFKKNESKVNEVGVGEEVTQEMKNDLIAAWNEVEEAHTSLSDLTKDELTLEVMQAIIQRLADARDWLGKYVSEEDVMKDVGESKTNEQADVEELQDIIQQYNIISRSIPFEEWNDEFMFPSMEVAPDRKIRFSWIEWTGPKTGNKEQSKYIDLDDAKDELEQLKKMQESKKTNEKEATTWTVQLVNEDGVVVDQTPVDEKSDDLAWSLFKDYAKESGYKITSDMHLEWKEGDIELPESIKEMVEKRNAKYQSLAENLFYVVNVSEKKDESELDKTELGEAERKVVLKKYQELLKVHESRQE